MKNRVSIVLLALIASVTAFAQKRIQPDLFKLAESHKFIAVNREPVPNNEPGKKGVHMDEAEDDGFVWIDGVTFDNGTIELDIKGRDMLQKSFLGVAFHGSDDNTTADIIYFRPFNFRSTDSVRKIHAVQYVSPPEYDWKKLREEQNGKFEKGIVPPPAATEWFHAKIVVHTPKIEVFVNGNKQASLTVDKLNTRKSGKVGLWVGTQSDGNFANLVVTKE